MRAFQGEGDWLEANTHAACRPIKTAMKRKRSLVCTLQTTHPLLQPIQPLPQFVYAVNERSDLVLARY